jgi:hypothetical protein
VDSEERLLARLDRLSERMEKLAGGEPINAESPGPGYEELGGVTSFASKPLPGVYTGVQLYPEPDPRWRRVLEAIRWWWLNIDWWDDKTWAAIIVLIGIVVCAFIWVTA